MQPPEHLHRPRGSRARIFDIPVPHQRLLAGNDTQHTAAGLELEEVRHSTRRRCVSSVVGNLGGALT